MLIHPADIQHRHTTGDRLSFNTHLHTQLTTIQSHILAQHKLHSIQLHTSSNNHKEHLLWWGKMGWNARTNDAAARFKLSGKVLGVTSTKYCSELNTVPKWQTYIGRSVPLVSAADWLNSQSADRLNIHSADWPVPRSSGDITQADQPTLQKPSVPSPFIQDTIHTTYTHTNNHTTAYTHNS